MKSWRDCIVIYFDLVGTKKLAAARPAGSVAMRSLHALVSKAVSNGFKAIDHVYLWNDSVLLFAYVDNKSYGRVMRAADDLKRVVDGHIPCYAIAAKGQAFPALDLSLANSERITVLQASSFAMANCFAIEGATKKCQLRGDWYVDGRIAKRVTRAKGPTSITVEMLPTAKPREVFIHKGYLWPIKSQDP